MKNVILCFFALTFISCGQFNHTLSGGTVHEISFKDCYSLPNYGTKKALELGYSKEECIRDFVKNAKKSDSLSLPALEDNLNQEVEEILP